MSARWDRDDYWPEVDYARRPSRQRVDWFVVVIWTMAIVGSFAVWSLILWVIWSQVG